MDDSQGGRLEIFPKAVVRNILWSPDRYELAAVMGAAEEVLCDPDAPARDRAQATYLITTCRPR